MNRRYLLLLVTIALGCCSCDDPSRSDQAISRLNQAKSHFDAAGEMTDRDSAIESLASAKILLNQAIDSDELENQDLADAYALRAAIHHSFGQYPLDESRMREAVSDLNSAIDLDPENLGHYYQRARAYDFLDENNLAIEDFTHILQVSPKSPRARGSRGFVFLELGDYDAAIDDLTAEIELDPSDMPYIESRGDAFAAIEDYQNAIDDYRRVKALLKELDAEIFGDRTSGGFSPALIDIETKIAVTFEKIEDLDQARAEYEEILSQNPNDPWANQRLEALGAEK
jgi:tetratricopeptide (TPR) repeat protein